MFYWLNKKVIFTFLLLFTTIINAQVLFYAHRGGGSLWPENTLCAFGQSLKLLNIDFIDMDVQLSKDGIMMVTHNSGLALDITRDATGQWIKKKIPIRHLSAKELRQYKLGRIKPGTSYAKEFANQQPMQGCYMPTLYETIDFIKKNSTKPVGFQIELKVPMKQEDDNILPKKYAKKIVSLLKKKHIVKYTEVQSFDFRILTEIGKIASEVKLAFLTENQQGNDKLFKKIKSLNGVLWEPLYQDVTPKSIRLAHTFGLRVVVWGLPSEPANELKQMRIMIKAGVDGIITDNPNLISKI